MMRLIAVVCLLQATQSHASSKTLDLEQFTKTPKAPIADSIVKKVVKMHDLDASHCRQEHFTSAIKGNLRAVYSNEDSCDGGNSFGYIFDISTFKITHKITDSDVEVIK